MLKRTASACLTPLALRAARSYIAGPELADALAVARRLAQRGFRTTLGFWDGVDDSRTSVAQEYVRAIAALAGDEGDCYLSIKLPAIGNSRELLDRVLEQARARLAIDERVLVAAVEEVCGEHPLWHRANDEEASPSDSWNATEGAAHREFQRTTPVRIHFDSLAPESADETWSAAVAAVVAGSAISCSLPGRWRRSIADAETAIEAGIVPRVVKGQWPDSGGRDIALRVGFMQIIRRLAGRASHVAVASHDVSLAREAIRCLRAAGTNCELELLYGLPERAAVAMARQENVPVRFYVPYGRAYLPYCLGQMRRQPRLLWWLVRDALRRA